MEIDMISNMEWFEGSFTNCAYRTYVYIYIYKKEKNNEIPCGTSRDFCFYLLSLISNNELLNRSNISLYIVRVLMVNTDCGTRDHLKRRGRNYFCKDVWEWYKRQWEKLTNNKAGASPITIPQTITVTHFGSSLLLVCRVANAANLCLIPEESAWHHSEEIVPETHSL